MTLYDFFAKWDGKGLDFDGAYGFQCVDVFKQFNKDVVGGPAVSGNAVDYWTKYPTDFYNRILNTIDAVPKPGSVIIWGTGVGRYGHIAICSEANKNDFISFDQNWPLNVDADGNGLGVCHFQPHTYNSVLGWLEPKSFELGAPNVPVINPDNVRVDIGGDFGILEVQAIRSKLNDLTRDLATASEKAKQYEALKTALIDEWQMGTDTTMADIIAESRLLHDNEETADKLRTEIEGVVGHFDDDAALLTALQGVRIEVERKIEMIAKLEKKIAAMKVPAGYEFQKSWTWFAAKYLFQMYKRG